MGWQLTARVNAAVPQLFIQLFIDKQLSIHCSHNHMIHLPYILETFEPVQHPPPPPPQLLTSNITNKVGSQFQFLRYLKLKDMLLVFSMLCGFCRSFCGYKKHNKHSKPHRKVHSGNSVHSGKQRTHKNQKFMWCMLGPQHGLMAEAIRTTVVSIRILIRTTVVPITPLIGTTVVRIRILIGTTGT